MNITQSFVSERDRALLGGDYQSYRAQATRRVHTLRKTLGVTTPRGRKYTPKSAVTVENVSQNAQWVQLLLACSERAWADAMTMKVLQSSENTQRPMAGSTKKQIVSRYRRAILYASNLVDVLSDGQSKANNTNLLEAKAYLALLKGGLDFEKGRWTSCIQHYAVVRLIYVGLDTTTKADLYRELMSTTIDPSIKYAAYQSRLPRTKAVSDVAIENFPASESSTRKEIEKLNPSAFLTTSELTASTQAESPGSLPATLVWRSRKVNIEDASVSQALGLAQDKEKQLAKSFDLFGKGEMDTKTLAAEYEEVINAMQETVDAAKSTIDDLRAQGVDQGDNRVQSLQVIRTAVNYAVIEWRIGRNRVLCGMDDGLSFDAKKAKVESPGRQLSRLRERVVLYDSILQSLEAVKELPGVVADAQLVEEIDQKKLYFRSLKCLALGRSHALNNAIVDALALYSRAMDLSKSSSKNDTAGDARKTDVSEAQLAALRQLTTSMTTQYQGLAELTNLASSKSTRENASSPLIQRYNFNQYDEELDAKNLVNFPAKLQPIPVKPLFFDLAWNYINYPGHRQEAAVESKPEPTVTTEEKDQKPAKRGWFGFGR